MVYRYRFISDERAASAPERVYTARAKVRVYNGTATWYFATVPVMVSRRIRKAHHRSARGWGSLPVTAHIAGVEWRTSIFPDSRTGTYLLPLKADIRKSAGIGKGDTVALRLTLATGVHRGAGSI